MFVRADASVSYTHLLAYDPFPSEELAARGDVTYVGLDELYAQSDLVTVDVYKRQLYNKDGALWFRSTDLGDDKDRVLVKANGEYTYFASDVADVYKRQTVF